MDTVMSEATDASSRQKQDMAGLSNGVAETFAVKPFEVERSADLMEVDTKPAASAHAYVPQFDGASRALILERLRNGSQALKNAINTSSTAESTLILPETASSPANLAALLSSSTHQRLTLKRKQPDEPSTSASSSSFFTTSLATLPLPTPQHASYPQHYHPSPDTLVSPPTTCSKCSARSSPGNILVSCSKCTMSLHQQCSIPPVDDFRARDGSFVCRECLLRGEGLEKKPRRLLAEAQQEDLERMRRRRLDALPDGVLPAKPSLVGFKGGDASSAARSQYFSDIQPTDLLNIISFSNQLKPQLLVDLLVSISKRHPDLPIFDSPDWSSHLPPLPPSSSYHHHHHRPRIITKPQPRHVPKTKQKSSKAGGGTKKVSKPPTRIREVQQQQQQQVETPEEVIEVEEDVMPATWRKAGQGLYAMLPLETEDRRFLVEENDEEAFSHFMVDKTGHQVIDPV